jgi:hydrogenase maturation factor
MSESPILPIGKVSKDVLERLVFTCLGTPSNRLIIGPKVGEDAALIDMGDKILIAKANPITGAVNRIGWLAVHVNANDVAVRGARPLWYMSIVFLPEGSKESLLETIMKDQHEACNEIGICVVGGHTEVAPDLNRPIIAGFMMGEVSKERFISTGGARPGDLIILTKGAGIEGTGILANDLEDLLRSCVKPDVINRGKLFLNRISVLEEALTASKIEGVSSIHTPTEGGVLNGLMEIANASGFGFRIYAENLLVADETRIICEALGIDPLRLLSSGSLLIVVNPDVIDQVLDAFVKKGIRASIIGEFKEGESVIVDKDGVESPAFFVEQDELFRILEESE